MAGVGAKAAGCRFSSLHRLAVEHCDDRRHLNEERRSLLPLSLI
jgi:hypothetical protein